MNTPTPPLSSDAERQWSLSSQYHFDTRNKNPDELSAAEQAHLLLFPPPTLPSFVETYLNVDSRLHQVQRELMKLRKVSRVVGGVKRKRGVDTLLTGAIGNDHDDDEDVEMTTDPSPLPSIRRALTATRIHSHLMQTSHVARLDVDGTTAAAKFITDKHETTIIDGLVWRKRDRVKRQTSSNQDLMTELKLNVLRDACEQEICAHVDRTTDPSVNETDKTRHKVAQLVAHRVSQRSQEQSQLKATLKQLAPSLTSWLQTQTNRVLLLSDGVLTLRDQVKKKTITRESMKEALCEYLIERGAERPLEATLAVMRGL